jgi:hypothetical protein
LQKKLIIKLVFKKNAIFCQKMAKIAENCDQPLVFLEGLQKFSEPLQKLYGIENTGGELQTVFAKKIKNNRPRLPEGSPGQF